MKEKLNGPVAAVIIVVAVLLLCGGLYRKFIYQPTYTVEDLAAKYRGGAKANSVPPNHHQQGAGAGQ